MRLWRLESGSESGRWVRAGLCVRACEGGGSAWHGAHHVGHLRLRGGVDVLQGHGAVLHHETHLGELGLGALVILGTRVGEEDVGDLAPQQVGVELVGTWLGLRLGSGVARVKLVGTWERVWWHLRVRYVYVYVCMCV